MKNAGLFFILLFVLGMGFMACDDDLVLTAPPKDIPIVYALINESDLAHYVRIEKAFLDPTTSALEIAKITDSIYYQNITVTIDGQELTRVDGNQEGFFQEEGIFENEPNVLYKIDANDLDLEPNDIIQFELNRGENLDLVTASTAIVGKPQITRPNPATQLSIIPSSTFRFLWLTSSDNQAFFDLNMFVHLTERKDGNAIKKKLKYSVAKGISEKEFQIDGKQFYSFLKGQLDADGSTRTLDSIDVEVNSGGTELREFLRVRQANTGITSSQDIPQYTNISEGLGVFSSINKNLITGYDLSQRMRDSLRNSPTTSGLNF